LSDKAPMRKAIRKETGNAETQKCYADRPPHTGACASLRLFSTSVRKMPWEKHRHWGVKLA
jgi:hypothetical protein